MLLPETDAAGGYVVGEKLRRDIHALTLRAADRNVRSSVSVGLVAYPDDGSTIEQLVAAADVAMYEAKRRGKNRIVGYQTRTERVATDIDGDSHDLVQLTPSDSVRTGGDPVPWSGSRSDGGAGVSYGEPVGESRFESPGQRRSDRSTIPVQPDDDSPAAVVHRRDPAQPRARTATTRGLAARRAASATDTDAHRGRRTRAALAHALRARPSRAARPARRWAKLTPTMQPTSGRRRRPTSGHAPDFRDPRA